MAWPGSARGEQDCAFWKQRGFRTTQAYHKTTTGGSCCDSSTVRNSLSFCFLSTDTINLTLCRFLSSPSASIILSSSIGLADNLEDICVCKKGLLLIFFVFKSSSLRPFWSFFFFLMAVSS